MSPQRELETYTAELLFHLLDGLCQTMHADFTEDHPDPRLKSRYTARGSEVTVLYKGQFYRISVEPESLISAENNLREIREPS